MSAACVNDQTVALVAGKTTPEKLAQAIQDAWSLNR